MEPRGMELIRRYKKNYHIPEEAVVTEEMILAHWELEKKLKQELLQSSPENRWKTFEKCYTRLYSELTWLNELTEQDKSAHSADRFTKWLDALGDPPQSIYEVGSGRGELLAFLANKGYQCKGTEITTERGEKLSEDRIENLEWGTTDGIHLDKFEKQESFDRLISDQVIEHLHPFDLDTHLFSAYSILKPEGIYIFSTPHRFTGPHDVSRVFKQSEPKGMHLKEYIYKDLAKAASQAGFRQIYYAFTPGKIQTIAGAFGLDRRKAGKLYLDILTFTESILAAIPIPQLRKWISITLWKIKIFPNNVNIAAEK